MTLVTLLSDTETFITTKTRGLVWFVTETATTIEDRIRECSGEVDSLDEKLAKRIAIEPHIVSKAADYVTNVSGLT